MTESRHVMIGGVGHPYLRDISVGPVLVPRLKEIDWPVEVEVEVHDLHFGPIHVVQWLEEKPGYFSRVVLLSAANRAREPGAVYAYRWDGALPDPEEIHQRVCEAVTGIIGIDNLLIIGSYFNVWPGEVVVVEVEPCEEEFGAELSAHVSAAAPRIIELVRDLALGPLDGLSADPLGPPRIGAAHPANVSEARI